MFGTKVVFGNGVLCKWIYFRLNQIQEAVARRLGKFRINIGLSISGIRYLNLIHYHESSFTGIWERIMREE